MRVVAIQPAALLARIPRAALSLFLALVGFPAAAPAARVILRIQAGNPIDTPQRVEIKSNLPARVGTNDIVSLGGLELGYDVKNDLYYVHKEVELSGKQIAEYNVELNDIWTLPEEQLSALERHAEQLVKLLEGKDFQENARGLQEEVRRTVRRIREHQDAYAIKPGVKPMQHIQAYEANLRDLSRARKDVGRIENLCMAAGVNPGGLLGSAADSPPPRQPKMDPGDYGAAIIRLTVRNTSATDSRRVDIKRVLPAEVGAADVLDAAGLEVGVDGKEGKVYVFAKGVALEPGEERVYDIRIRDKWNVNGPRIADLRLRLATAREQIGDREQFAALAGLLTELDGELAVLEQERGPEQIGSRYVEFYRGQSERLRTVEERLHRIEAALRPIDPRTRVGFDMKPPSMKTTWLIIYIILGFLGVLSILFFLRWMGRTKGEQLGT